MYYCHGTFERKEMGITKKKSLVRLLLWATISKGCKFEALGNGLTRAFIE